MKTLQFAVLLLLFFSCCVNKEVTNQKCETLSDQSEKDGCYQEQGIVTSDPSYCEKIEGADFRDRCFFRLAIDLSKPALCGRIDKENDNNHCLAITLRDDSFCAKVDRVDRKDKCYYDLGSTGHESSCGMINDSFFRDNCYVTYGYNKGDLAICEKIENAEKRKSCYYSISEKGGWSDPGTCDMLPEEYRDECFVRMIASAAKKTPEI